MQGIVLDAAMSVPQGSSLGTILLTILAPYHLPTGLAGGTGWLDWIR